MTIAGAPTSPHSPMKAFTSSTSHSISASRPVPPSSRWAQKGQKQILAALGANLQVSVQQVQAACDTIRSSRILLMQLELPVECVTAAARLAHDAGVRIVLDPAPPRSLPDDL